MDFYESPSMSAPAGATAASAQNQHQHQQQPKPVKACDACHAIKVKCVQDDDDEENAKTPCARCTRLNMPCTFTPRVRKKQQKRTDARVASLEKEVENLRSALAASHNFSPSAASPSSSSLSKPSSDGLRASATSGGGVLSAGSTSSTAAASFMPSNVSGTTRSAAPAADFSAPPSDVRPGCLDSVQRGIGSATNVQQLLDLFNTSFAPLQPVVQLDSTSPAGAWTPQELAEKRPLVLQAIIGVTSVLTNPSLSYGLQCELTKSYVATLAQDDPRSFDLVQAILITVSWNIPPPNFGKHRAFYQLAHLAVSTALELGLDSDSDGSEDELDSFGQNVDPRPAKGTSVEKARAFLGCFMLAQGLSMTMRRPSMLHGTDGVTRAIDVLESNPYITRADVSLVSHAKLFQIAEEISNSLLRKEIAKGIVVSDKHVRNQIQKHRDKLLQWHENAGLTSLDAPIQIMFHYTMTYLHEIALYPEHSPKDFSAPFKLDKVGLSGTSVIHSGSSSATSPSTMSPGTHTSGASPDYAGTSPPPISIDVIQANLMHLIRSAHSLVDVFLSLDPCTTMRCLPVANFFRLVYCAVILTKLVMSPLDPRSTLGRMVDRRILRTEYYRASILRKLSLAAGEGRRFPSPALFTQHLIILGRNWMALERRLSGRNDIAAAHRAALERAGADQILLDQAGGEELVDARATRDGFQAYDAGGDNGHHDPSSPSYTGGQTLDAYDYNNNASAFGKLGIESAFPVSSSASGNTVSMDGLLNAESSWNAGSLDPEMLVDMQDLGPALDAWEADNMDASWAGMLEGQSPLMDLGDLPDINEMPQWDSGLLGGQQM